MTSIMQRPGSEGDDRVVRWALVAAVDGAEKAAVVARVVAGLGARGARVGGFVQLAPDGGEHVVVRLTTRERADLGRRGTKPRSPDEEVFCSFSFDRRAFERARAWLLEDAAAADVVVVDEIGKLEAAGKGHSEALAAALASRAVVVAVVRAHQLPYVVERFGLGDAVAALEPPFDDDAIERFCAEIAAARA